MRAVTVDRLVAFSLVRRFRALNTDVEVSIVGPAFAQLLVAAERVFADVERRFSRFRTDSELSRLNESCGVPTRISNELAILLRRALDLHEVTEGAFDPGVLPDLEVAGYDRSFELVPHDVDRKPHSAQRPSISSLRFDREGAVATLPRGLRIDLGGIGKGYAVDVAAEVLGPARDFMVNAGGDIRAGGNGIDGDGWLASVVHPCTGDDVSTVRLRNEALATSTTARRRWIRDGHEMHHIIDPRTRAPARSDVVSASVIALSAIEADVFAKTVVILGRREGLRFTEAQHCPALVVLADGGVRTGHGWPRHSLHSEVRTCEDD
jgi:thiamine biosynthesis lipoprotein